MEIFAKTRTQHVTPQRFMLLPLNNHSNLQPARSLAEAYASAFHRP
jgi:hypothetical protein